MEKPPKFKNAFKSYELYEYDILISHSIDIYYTDHFNACIDPNDSISFKCCTRSPMVEAFNFSHFRECESNLINYL